MSALYQELDYQQTPLGPLMLRRRRVGEQDIFEVKLGDDFLMSSQFTRGEEELAALALARIDGDQLDVLVGGLGLGYTACAALTDARIANLVIVEKFAPVVDWCAAGLIPNGVTFGSDGRTQIVIRDFFEWAAQDLNDSELCGIDRFHAVLLDIDHSPVSLLDARNETFYSAPALRRFAERLHPGGVFALWSNEAPAEDFMATLRDVFDQAEAAIVDFPSPATGRVESNTIYLASKRR
ncbi:MAG: hypothetical protein ACK4X1_00390 [Terricaulis sp.]